MTTAISTISPGLAAAYSPTETYAKDAFVLFQNKYWRCVVAISEPEAWNEDHWVEAENLLNGVNEVILGGTTPPTDGKLWVDYSDAPVPTEVSKIADFDPTSPSQYVRDFANGSAVLNKVTSIVNSLLGDADTTEFPEGSDPSSSSQYFLLGSGSTSESESGALSGSESPFVPTEAKKSDFHPTSPASYVNAFISGSAMSDAVEAVLDAMTSDSSGYSWSSSSESAGETRTNAWVSDFDPTEPEDYVVAFLHGSFMHERIRAIILSLYGNATDTLYPSVESSSSLSASSYPGSSSSESPAPSGVARISDFDPSYPAQYVVDFLNGSVVKSVITRVVLEILAENASSFLYPASPSSSTDGSRSY